MEIKFNDFLNEDLDISKIDPYSEEEWDDDNTTYDYDISEIMQQIQGTYTEKLEKIREWLVNKFIVDTVILRDNYLYFQFKYRGIFREKSAYGEFYWKFNKKLLKVKLICEIGSYENRYMMGNMKHYWEELLVKNRVPKKQN